MQFESILRDLVLSVDGAEGAIFLEADGEAVQWYSKSDADRLRLRAAYLAVLVQACRASVARLGLGNGVRLTIEYEGARFLTEEVDQGYFIVLELKPSSNLGQAILRMIPAASHLRTAITA